MRRLISRVLRRPPDLDLAAAPPRPAAEPVPAILCHDGHRFVVDALSAGLLYATCRALPGFLVTGRDLDAVRAHVRRELPAWLERDLRRAG